MGRTGMIPHDNRENPLSRVINKFDISGQARQPSRRSRSKITAKPVYAVRDILMTSSRKTSSPARLERFHVVYKFLCFSCNLIKNKNKKQFSSRAPSPDQLPTSVSLPKSRRICVSIPVVAEIFSFFFCEPCLSVRLSRRFNRFPSSDAINRWWSETWTFRSILEITFLPLAAQSPVRLFSFHLRSYGRLRVFFFFISKCPRRKSTATTRKWCSSGSEHCRATK